MENIHLDRLINDWEKMTGATLDLKEIEIKEMQRILKETYAVLTRYHKETLVPKQISRLLLEAESFLYFSSLMEEKEVGEDFYRFRKVFVILKAMKTGFLKGEYKSQFPKITLSDDKKNLFELDFDSAEFEDFLK